MFNNRVLLTEFQCSYKVEAISNELCKIRIKHTLLPVEFHEHRINFLMAATAKLSTTQPIVIVGRRLSWLAFPGSLGLYRQHLKMEAAIQHGVTTQKQSHRRENLVSSFLIFVYIFNIVKQMLD